MLHSDAVKAALWTALWSFLGLFALLTLTPWIADVAQWADSRGAEPFPDLSVLGYGLISALAATASGLIGFLVRALQAAGVLPGSGPGYGRVADSASPEVPPPYEGG